jgi:hypothetical protein
VGIALLIEMGQFAHVHLVPGELKSNFII